MAAAPWGFFFVLLLLLSGDVQSSEVPGATAEGSGGSGVGIGDRFKIEGRAVVPGVKPQDWISAARVLVDGEEHVGFLKTDGSFVVHDIPSGSYVVEVISPAYRFDPVRVDITSKGKMRARYVNYIKTSEVVRLPYPLQMKSSGPPSYFIKRESWGWTDFLMNPMVMMMVLPLLIFVLLPKVVNTSDPDMRRVEDDSDAETYGEENDEQGNYSKRKIVTNWDRYQDIEKEVDNESGESQRGTDFSVLLSSAGDSFAQFRFAEEKEWDAEASCPKQNSAFYVDCESLVRALQELPISLRLNVAAELVQTALPLELPQVKPKRNDEGKGLGMQLKGPLGPGGKGSVPELKPATAGCPMYLGNDSPRPGPSKVSQKPASPPQSAADHLEEELDLLLNLDAPVRERENMLPDQIFQDLEPKKEGEVAQEEKVPEKASVMEENNVESEQPSTSKHVTEEELEDWLDSMIS
uniref:Apoptosis and caspase activation inhibitor n=1 Tax=Equus caballus TaxID=9796 RepID=A0A9L0RBU0_HORSE